MSESNVVQEMAKQETFDAILARVVRRLVEALEPTRIYLFGSRARADWRTDSDLDLLVVLPDSEGPTGRDYLRAYKPLIGLGIPCDIVPCLESDFAAMRDEFGGLIYRVAREGRLVYDREQNR